MALQQDPGRLAEMSFSPESNVVSDCFKPLVTIVIPVYNGADFLADAIQSALDQTYGAIEIIVVNDGSNDGGATDRLAQSFGDSIRYFSKKNGGVASALNLAILKMSGDYFSWLSHDDLYHKEKIAAQVNALTSIRSDKAVLYSDYAIFADDPDEAVQIKMPGVPPERFRYWLMTQSALHGCTLLIPRLAFDECGGFNEQLRTTQDYDLWFRIAQIFRFVHVPEVLVKARSHLKQGSMSLTNLAFNESCELHTGFVNGLTIKEIESVSGQSVGNAYLTVASSMWCRGFAEAGACAARLASQYGVSQFRIYRTMSVANLRCRAFRFSRYLFAPRTRQILRGIWHRIKPGLHT